ncbi:hypothetical protein M758_UG223300 [Ceratodon purpureus]|nr:hypothetical protein M758_UG223300 [Ceratodon purpureus]
MTESQWSKGEEVCRIYLEHVRERGVLSPLELGERNKEVLAYGRIGVTCRTFRPFVYDPAIKHNFVYDLEIYMEGLPQERWRVFGCAPRPR